MAVVWLATLVAQEVSAQSCNGRCVPLKDCLMEEDDPAPEVDLRVGQEDSDVVSECPHYLDICCPLDMIVEVPPRTSTNTASEEKFGACGQRHPDGVGFRLGGGKVEESEFGEFPWTLLVLELQTLFDFEAKEVYACVGSLLAPNVVLTVAHCVINRTASSLVVRAGEWDTRSDSEVLPSQDSKVKEIYVHDRYNKHHHFDVALLVLEKPFRAAENVQTVCLPPPGVRPETGSECITGGWGKDRFGKMGVYQQILKRVSLPIVESGKCQQALRKTRLGPNYKLHNTFLCAGGKQDADVCSGDGGAALVCPVPGSEVTYYQAGIVAWGIGCGDENIPGVYVDATTTRTWIVDQLKALNVDPAFYTAP